MLARLLTATAVMATMAACVTGALAEASTSTADVAAVPLPTASMAGQARLEDWPEFGLDPQRSDVSERPTGITADNVIHLADKRVTLPGTVDSSPIYLHGAIVDGGTHDTIVVTTTYGRTIALDAASGLTLWTFTPAGFDKWAGSAQITTASPIADPDRKFVYAASPDGLIHKLSLANGREDPSGVWPARITLDPQHEKIAAALNVDGPDVIATTGGYIGDVPPYQGHVALIARADGRLRGVFNTLCSDRRRLISTSSCSASDSAILSRAGAVVEPGGRRILIDTGNAPWNGTTDFGDSVLELSFPGLSLRQAFTPTNQSELNRNDTDLGSSAPALLGHNRVMVAGKDGIIRLLSLSSLNGHRAGSPTHRLGGEVQRLETPGGGELFSAPAVWQHAGGSTAFVADKRGTAAYALRGGKLLKVWENNNAGTSPVMAGGLLYVYDQLAGGIYVYRPSSPQPLAKLPGEPGHWNSPIVVDGHVIEAEGDANERSQTGTIEIFSGS
jgi:outer membrane protein assembly factor BamB